MFTNTVKKLLVLVSIMFVNQANAINEQPSQLCSITLADVQSAYDAIQENKKNTFKHALIDNVHKCQRINSGSLLDTDMQPTTLADDSPPELRSLSLSSNNINLDNGTVKLTFTVKAYDLSGIESVTLGILAPEVSYPFPAPQNKVKLESWTETKEKNVYEASGSITLHPSKIEAGKWRTAMYFLRDVTGRYVTRYRPDMLEKKGFNPYIIIENNTVLDKKAPEFKSLTFSSNSFDVTSKTQTLKGVVKLYDVNKVVSAKLQLSPPKGLSASLSKFSEFENIRATEEENVYQADVKLELDNTDAPGVWTASLYKVQDDKQNVARFINSDVIRDTGSNPDIEIINTVDVDLMPPELRALEVSEHDLTVTANAKNVTISLLVYDPSGIKKGYISLISPTGESGLNKQALIEDWQPTSQDGVFSAHAQFTFTQSDEAGNWYVKIQSVFDKNDNKYEGSNISHLIEHGMNPYILVNVDEQYKRDYLLSTNLDDIKVETKNSKTVELFIHEVNGYALPTEITLLAKKTDSVSVSYVPSGSNTVARCKGEKQLLTCDLNTPAEHTELKLIFELKVTDKPITDDIHFTLITDDAETNIKNNKTSIAVTIQEPTFYEVEFLDWDGRIVAQQQVKAGESAKPVEVQLERVGYTFTGWDKALTNITIDTSIIAQYEINHYMVKFINWDGAVLSQSSVVHGGSAVPPPSLALPEGKVFDGWDTDFEYITSNIDINAIFKAKTYTVEFKDWDGTTILSLLVEHGKPAEAPKAPTRAGYTFLSWDKAFDSIKQRELITAQYSKTIEKEVPKANAKSDSGTFGLFSLLFGLILVLRRKVC